MASEPNAYFQALQWLLAEELHRNPQAAGTASVHVAVPTYGMAPAICMLSFGSFIGHGAAAGLIKNLGEVDGAYIDRSRNDLVRQAKANGSTHVMFMDQDMILPEGVLTRLLAHDAPIVGGSYWGKDDWFTPVSFHLDSLKDFRRIYELEDCPVVETEAPLPAGSLDCWCGRADNHLHRVGGTGMGVTLVSIDLFLQMEEHFNAHPCPCGSGKCDGQRWFSTIETGEDIHLALRARELGVDWLLDGFVQCGHVRNQIVTRQHYDWAKKMAPRCKVDGCERAAFWDVRDADQAESAERCWLHRDVEAPPEMIR